MPGSGTMTPVGTGIGIGLSLAQPIPYTLLSLSRYAKIMGISPLHFWRGATPGLDPVVFPDTGCSNVWFKYDWQNHDAVSWMSLAATIQAVEEELATLIGYYPAPMWIAEEEHQYRRPYPPEYFGNGLNNRGEIKSVKADKGRIITTGRRSVTLIGTVTAAGATLAYTDEDGDGFYETATVTLPTTLTSIAGIKVYFTGKSGEQEWEIRYPRTARISGGNYIATFDSWLFIDPDLYEDFPTSDGIAAIDVSDTSHFVTSVDVYREYADPTLPASVFTWETQCSICGGCGCSACSPTTQNGCLNLRDPKLGVVIPTPASYDAATASWTIDSWTNGYEPHRAKIWYQAGEIDPAFTRGIFHDPLSNYWAQIIAWIATARLERPLCSCSNLQAVSGDLQTDLTNDFGTELSPFGNRKGEIKGWQRIKHQRGKKISSYALA
jgi:hypothetical protein